MISNAKAWCTTTKVKSSCGHLPFSYNFFIECTFAQQKQNKLNATSHYRQLQKHVKNQRHSDRGIQIPLKQGPKYFDIHIKAVSFCVVHLDKVLVASVISTCVGGGKVAHRGRDTGAWYAVDVKIFSVI